MAPEELAQMTYRQVLEALHGLICTLAPAQGEQTNNRRS